MDTVDISLFEKLEEDLNLIVEFMSDKVKVSKIYEDDEAISRIGETRLTYYIKSSLYVISTVISESKRVLSIAPTLRKDFEDLVNALGANNNLDLSKFEENSSYKYLDMNIANNKVILKMGMLPNDYVKDYFSTRTNETLELKRLFFNLNLSLSLIFIWRSEIKLLLEEFKKYQSRKPQVDSTSDLEAKLSRLLLQSRINEQSVEVLKNENLSSAGRALIESLSLYSDLLSEDCEKVREELTYEKNRLTFLGPIEIDLIGEAINPQWGLKSFFKYRKS